MAAAAGSVQYQGRGSARFAAACGVLSQYVKAAATVAEARPVAVLPLMPGADVPVAHEAAEAEAGPAPQQLTISYGGRVVVLEDVPADRAAELLRLAAAQGAAPRALAAGDLPVARKASLQRFMEKRRGRAAARGSPYSRPDAAGASPHPDHLALAL
ncbi:ZIM motif family protein [Panicum miliaceum]|uniref:Protein TIFY n=1 Tax=Panicum miliaceum TaxID=4540 RepID=A0A3L6TL97_PANMI|nr:ZIM motif family protein [Panicum miliaceum]